MYAELDQEMEILEMKRDLTSLKIELRNCEKWIDYAKETAERLQNKIMDWEDKKLEASHAKTRNI